MTKTSDPGTLMPAEQFDALVESLDVPDDPPNLTRAFANKRRFIQRDDNDK